MSETAIRRALALSEQEAVACGLIWSRTAIWAGQGVSQGAGAGAGPPMTEVLRAVARASGLDREKIRGPGQSRRAAHIRQLVMYLLRELCPGASLPAIGHYLGRDHSTVLHGCRRAAARLDRDPAFRRIYEAARRELGPLAGSARGTRG